MLDFLEVTHNSPTELARTYTVQIPCLQEGKLKPREKKGRVPAGWPVTHKVLYRLPSSVR